MTMQFRDIEKDPLAYQARNHNLDTELIKIIVSVVSGGNQYKVDNSRNVDDIDYGLMQLSMNKLYALGIDVSGLNLMEPGTNLMLGCKAIRRHLDQNNKNIPFDYRDAILFMYPDDAEKILALYNLYFRDSFDGVLAA